MAPGAIPFPGDAGRPEETRGSERPRPRRPGGGQSQQALGPFGYLAPDDALPPVGSKLRRRRYNREDRRCPRETSVGAIRSPGRRIQEEALATAPPKEPSARGGG